MAASGPRDSRTGSCKTATSPACRREGPRARIARFFGAVPVMMNPAIITLSPVCTRMRVEMFNGRVLVPGFGVGEGLVPGEGDALGDGLTVALGDALGEALGDGLDVADGD